MTVAPTRDQLDAFAARGPDGPVRMLNLLRFHAQARYASDSGHTPCSGAEAYARYGEQMLQVLKSVGGKVDVLGECHAPVIGEERDAFDHMVIVYYPSRQALLDMLASDEYKQVAVHRTAAVEHSLLIPMTGVQTPLGSQRKN